MSVIAFSRAIGPVPIDVVMREKHSADLTITKYPIERGADATDHAFRQPNKLSLEIADEGGAATYIALKRFQQARIPFNIVSGLDVYTSMLIEHIEADLDATHAYICNGKADLTEVIIADVAADEADSGGEGRPGKANGEKAQPGGRKSTQSATPSQSRAKGSQTQARASSKVRRGDVATKTPSTPSRQSSIFKSLTG